MCMLGLSCYLTIYSSFNFSVIKSLITAEMVNWLVDQKEIKNIPQSASQVSPLFI